MTERTLQSLLMKADFSKETDLRDRLRSKLFGEKIVRMPLRQRIEDDDLLDLVNAAGEPVPPTHNDTKE